MRITKIKFTQNIKNWPQLIKTKKLPIALFVTGFAIFGCLLLAIGQAASPQTSLESEDGNRAVINSPEISLDSNASGGKAITFHTKPVIPTSGVYTGIVRGLRSGENTLLEREASIGNAETLVAIKYVADRQFYSWNETFNKSMKPYMDWTYNQGRYPIINLADRTVPWRDIEQATQGSAIYTYLTTMAQEIKTWGKPAFFIFHHEPENLSEELCNSAAGSGFAASNYVGAWKKIIEVFDANNVNNLSYMWDVVPYTATRKKSPTDSCKPDGIQLLNSWYPGDQYIDWIAGTPFNKWRDACVWKDLSTLIDPFYNWAVTNHPSKPIALPAYGTSEYVSSVCSPLDTSQNIDPSQHTQAAWISNITRDFVTNNRFPKVKLMAYYDVPPAGSTSFTPDDNRFYNDTPSPTDPPPPTAALVAYKAMIKNSYFMANRPN